MSSVHPINQFRSICKSLDCIKTTLMHGQMLWSIEMENRLLPQVLTVKTMQLLCPTHSNEPFQIYFLFAK